MDTGVRRIRRARCSGERTANRGIGGAEERDEKRNRDAGTDEQPRISMYAKQAWGPRGVEA